MTTVETCTGSKAFPQKILCLVKCKLLIAEIWLSQLVLLALRLFMGRVFWNAGQTKIANMDSTVELFEYEYIPNWESNSTKNILGMDITFPVPSAELGAKLATYAELGLPVLLVLGLGGRFAAIALFGMALTIELFIYPGTTEHYYWMLCLSVLIVYGPGKLSVDHFIRRWILPDSLTYRAICPTPSCAKENAADTVKTAASENAADKSAESD